MRISRSSLLALVATALMAAGCSGDENKCDGVTCGANASCNEDTGACSCKSGYSGDPTTGCTVAATCQADTCSGHGNCSVATGTPVCHCDPGWAGANCSSCAPGTINVNGSCVTDPCRNENCGGHGTCSVTENGAASCACAQGWAGETCGECAEGYSLVDGACVAISCDPNPCNDHGTCAIVDGAAVCTCTDNFAGPTCSACAEGYSLVDGACVEDVDPCAGNTCNGHGSCAVVDGAAVCTCTDNFAGPSCTECAQGYELVDGACVVVTDPCAGNTCSGHGTCAVVDGAAVCTCTGDFAGPACADCAAGFVLVDGACVDDACNPDPCHGHGTCAMDASNAAVCTCTGNFDGPTCDVCADGFQLVDGACVAASCEPDPCHGHGTCAIQGGSAVCTCTDNFTGTACDVCATDYALVGGACINSQTVPCDDSATPANATADVVDVTITYTTAGNWTAPEACEWSCDSGYHLDAGACAADLTITWCGTQWPTSYTKNVNETETIYGQVYSTSGAGTAAAGQLPGILAKVCHSTGAIDTSTDIATLTCQDATFNASATNAGNNDEYMSDLAFAAAGTYNYAYAFSGNGGQSWTVCLTGDSVAGVATITNGTAQTPSQQIAAVRATADGTGLALPVDEVIVTYLKPATSSSDPAGFFVQAEQAGPAIFVAVDPATLNPVPAVGSKVSFDVTELATVSGVKEITAITNFGEVSTGNAVTPLVQDITAATDVLTGLDGYESRAISLTATVASAFANAGTGHKSAQIDTDGITGDASLKLRLADSVVDTYDLVQNCMLTLNYGVMWRYTNSSGSTVQAQPSAYNASDLTTVVCPAPTVTGVSATSATEVVVTFDRHVAASSVLTDGSQFLIDGLTITAAAVNGKTVVLTTSAQTSGTAYDILVESTITDTLGEALAQDYLGSFNGYTAVAGGQPANGGLETWTDATTAADWVADSGCGLAQESTIIRTGTYSAKLTRNTTTNSDADFTSASIPVTVGQTYAISAWLFDNDVNGRARLAYLWLDASNAVVGTNYSNVYTADSTDWQEMTLTTVAAPATAVAMQVFVRIYTQTGGTPTGGFVFLDDVTVQ